MSTSQSDIIVIKALMDGFLYIRANPWQLDFAFEDVYQNSVRDEFGKREIDRAKEWFLNTNIPVFSTFRIDKPVWPCVTVQVMSSNEDKQLARLGESYPDLDGDEVITNPQNYTIEPAISAGPFNLGYVASTGVVTLPVGQSTALIFAGQSLQSRTTGKLYVITNVQSDSTFTIATNVVDNFNNAVVVPAFMNLNITRRTAQFREMYKIDCKIAGTPGELAWLHSVVTYILLQQRQYLLEQFNIQLGNLSSGSIEDDSINAESTENFYMRTIMMEGIVETTWVDHLGGFIEGAELTVNAVKDGDPTIYNSFNVE